MSSPLPLIGFLLGLLLVIKHSLALSVPAAFQATLKTFPRSRCWGVLLLASAAIWTFCLVATSDLGEFSPWRTTILLGTIVSTGLFGWLVPEFLAVRSLGFILLLAAGPLLEATFLQSGLLPKMIAILAYLWIISGFFMVGMPYLLRNAIATLSAPRQQWLWKLLSWIGLLYGILLLINSARLLILS
ncbi:MAG: hypothetical protein A3F67_07245 [Verrucomicrobia bacterium RIFCSPHIGHO2_12_FULL_41_10]|nr:MAG: hypothetical protein A3F67_07245 [Verrucomicrobia bacterium RIFCSPHIGHO2_12_FULL_41_10]HLB34477.1 hypothetical protein [Chthoniobacterales bacterium]